MIADVYELSPIQQGMLFHALSEPDSHAYINQLSCGLRGPLRPELFRQAWQALIDSEPVLRTSFHSQGLDKPLQVVHRQATLPWIFEDWRGLPAAAQKEQWRQSIESDRKTAFRLDCAPLMRCRLVRASENEYLFQWTHHHLLLDGWCLSVALRKLFEMYGRLERGERFEAPSQCPTYRDFILWLQRQDSTRTREFWKNHLAGVEHATPLPGCEWRGDASVAEARVSCRFSAARLAEFAAKCKVTLNTVIQAAWAILLARSSGEMDVVFGATVAGRPPELPGVEAMLGTFINTVPVRVQVNPEARLVPWLRNLQALQAIRSSHEHAALADIRQWCGVRGNEPLFESNVVFMNYPLDESLSLGGTGLAVSEVEVYDRTDTPLTLQVTPGKVAEIELLYDAQRFEEAAMRRWLGHLTQLLDEFAANPERTVGQCPILTAGEKRQILGVFNNTKADFDASRTFVARFEENAAAYPERIALHFEDCRIAYGDLNRRANRLARVLRDSFGLSRDDLAAVRMARSDRTVESILAIWKCGAAYVPIEPHEPEERVRTILAEIRAKVVVTEAELERIQTDFLRQEDTNLGVEVHPHDLAYVIFTSGSTGKPKGAMVEHAGMLNHLLAKLEDFEISPASIVAQNASHCFDVSVWQFFAALLAGGTTVIYLDSVVLDPFQFIAGLERDGITILEVVPSYLAALLPRFEERLAALPMLRCLAVTGEVVKPQLIEAWFRLFPAIPVINAYGPTEASDDITHCKMLTPPSTPSIPLGRPIRNTHIYIVDSSGNLCPVETKGEICVSGVGVGRGYLNDPDKTRLAFSEDPFREENGVRMYRTGDLGCWLPDGNLLLFGRKDHQVKIRGHRIELGEVEAALHALDQVAAAVVLDRVDDGRERYLCAYIVRKSGRDINADDMSRLLMQKLPEYMIPAFFVWLDRLPLTPNGKIDRRGLPAPDRSLAPRKAGYTAPRNPVETALCQIWGEALHIPAPGIHDDFFALGGDSIIAMQIVARAFKAGLKLLPKQVFQHSTVAQLALAAVPASTAASENPLSGPAPLTPIQRRFFEQQKADPHYYNQSVVLEVPADLDAGRLRRAVHAAVEKHEAPRLRFYESGGVWTQDAAPEISPDVFAVHDVAEEAFASAAEELHRSLNLTDGPLIRVGLFRFGPDRPSRLLFVAHHLVVDGVSWRILIEDVYTAYGAAALSPSPASYRQWAVRLDEYAKSGAPERELEFWLATGESAIPADFDIAENLVADAEEIAVELSESATGALLQESSRAYHTQINDLLLAALASTFRDWTGSERLLLEIESHGREHPAIDLDLSQTVGWFTAIYPVVLTAADSVRATIQQVKEQLRRVPNHGVHWSALRYGSAGNEIRDRLAALPQAQVLFNYLGQIGDTLPETFTWKPLMEAGGSGRSPRQRRDYLLEVNAFVDSGRLRIIWSYNRRLHERRTIERLAQSYCNHLERVIAHCVEAPGSILTPSDVPAARASQAALNSLATVVPGDVEDIYELTPAQLGMLFHSVYEPATGAYLNRLTCRIEGLLDEGRFREAWRLVVERHEALRTSYHWQGFEKPLQIVHRRVSLPWRFEDLRDTPADEDDHALEFDLTQAPLMRCALLRTGERKWRFHWTQHHLLLDGWSSAVVLNQVMESYTALVVGRLPNLPAPRPFREHLLWLQSQDLTRAERFWREELAGFRTPTPLMLGEPEIGGTAHAGRMSEEETWLVESESAALLSFTQSHGITLSTLAQGAWAILLSRYSGESDVLFGQAVSGRPAGLEGSDEMVGMFLNVLPTRTRIDPDASATDWLRQLQAKTFERDEYSFCGLTEIQSWSEVPGGTPLFESLLIVENYPVRESLRAGSRDLRIEDVQALEPNNYPLTLAVSPGSGLSLKVMYDDGRFDRATVRRLLGHYGKILRAILAAPNRRLAEISILTEEERRRIDGWNATDRAGQDRKTVVDLFEAGAEVHPDRVAVRCGDTTLTYRELNERSARRAGALLEMAHLNAEDRVAVLMPRSERLVESVLAIWKCGAAYVPVDPDYPPARVRLILENARPAAILTDGPLPPGVDVPANTPVSRIGEVPFGRAVESRAVPEGLAYVIFTSGSTGVPKGAMVEHRGLRNHILSMVEDLGLDGESRVAQTASHCFDISMWQMFAALVSGGETVIYPNAAVSDARLLAERFRADDITAAQFVPSYLNAFLDEMERWPQRNLGRLQYLVLIGETLKPSAVERWFALFPRIRLMNAYGPTEASDSITHFVMQSPPRLASVPVGRPIRNMRIYILDRFANLCPVGVKGEICVSGIGVGRGYLMDTSRTAEVFAPDPFREGFRMYRTGDIGCYAPDGNILFFGRRDSQVKIRGHRIELGEVESALASVEGIKDAAVIAREDRGHLTLAAYCAPREGVALAVSEIREALTRKLPDYMAPGSILILPDLPKTSNGKLDRKALPAPELASSAGQSDPPAAPMERALAGIWEEVLGRTGIGVNEHFFEAGGHSLRAIQVASRIRAEIKIDVKLRDIFEFSTIRALAAHLEAASRRDDSGIPAAAERAWYPASHTQKRIWLASRTEQGSISHNMASALRLSGELNRHALTQALDALVDRHESLRTVIRMVRGEIVQIVRTREESGFRLDVADIENDLDRLREQEARRPFDLQNGPLFRATLAREARLPYRLPLANARGSEIPIPSRDREEAVANSEPEHDVHIHFLLLTVHHSVADAWSMRVLLRDLAALYAAFAEGKPNPLAPLRLQFRDYACWQQQRLASGTMEPQREYWLGLLSDIPRPALPTDFPRPPLSYTAGRAAIRLPQTTVAGLTEAAQRNGASLYAVVLAAIFALLHRYTGQEDLAIGSLTAGRSRCELEEQVGCYLNTVVLRNRIGRQQTMDELVRATARMLMESLEHQEYPFDLLLEDLKAGGGIFDVQADYVPPGQPQTFHTPGLEIADVTGDANLVKYDLSFFTSDEPGRELQIALEYNTALFRHSTVEKMAARLSEILHTYVRDPRCRISDAVGVKKTVRAGLRLQ